MHERLRALIVIIVLAGVGILVAAGLSFFGQYIGTRVSGVPITQNVIGGALKSDSLEARNHTLEFRGRSRSGTQLTSQVSFQVQAPDDGGTEVEVARLKLWVDPRLIAGVSEQEIAQRLVRYVDDLNAVYAKNTVRRFVYDPTTDFEVWPEDSDNLEWTCATTSSDYSFQIYLAKVPDRTSRSWEGRNCTGLNFYQWRAVYSAENLATNTTLRDNYLRFQVFALIHELGHLHNVALGEYYSLAQLRDNSGIAPDLDAGTQANIVDNPYWSKRLRTLGDPMFGREAITGTLDLLEFSPLSAEIVNRVARGDALPECVRTNSLCLPAGHEVTVETVHALTRAPLSGCQVHIYRITRDSYQHVPLNSETSPMHSEITDRDGISTMPWSGPMPITNEDRVARLFKVECNGFQSNGDWLSVFDLQAGMLMPDGGVEGDFRYPGKFTIPLQPQ